MIETVSYSEKKSANLTKMGEKVLGNMYILSETKDVPESHYAICFFFCNARVHLVRVTYPDNTA